MSASASGKRPHTHTPTLASAPPPSTVAKSTITALSDSDLPLALQQEVASFLCPHSLGRLSCLARWRSFYLGFFDERLMLSSNPRCVWFDLQTFRQGWASLRSRPSRKGKRTRSCGTINMPLVFLDF
jgi:hypothetical protein